MNRLVHLNQLSSISAGLLPCRESGWEVKALLVSEYEHTYFLYIRYACIGKLALQFCDMQVYAESGFVSLSETLWMAEESMWDWRVPRSVVLSDTGAGTWGTTPWQHEKGKVGGQEACWDGSCFPTPSLTSSKSYLRGCSEDYGCQPCLGA